LTLASLKTRLERVERRAESVVSVSEGALSDAGLTWQEWHERRFPHFLTHPFAPHHIEYWNWIDALTPGVAPDSSCVQCWARGGGKSTTAEMGIARVGDKLSRRYVLIVCGTQEKADEHVMSVAALLERMGLDRAINKYGHSKGWRRQQLRAGNGFTVAGYGLDTGLRGAKIENYRPDWIHLDDVDELTDSLPVIQKKSDIITKSILPAGSSDLAVSFTQNAIHRESLMSRMIDGRADFLLDRNKVIPIPALYDMTYEEVGDKRVILTGGIPAWEGQNLAVCQRQVDKSGLDAFLTEAQHEVYTADKNAYFDTLLLNRWLMEVRSGMHTPLTNRDFRPYALDYSALDKCLEDGTLKLWELPQKGGRYIVTGDPAGGVNTDGQRDACSADILDADTWCQVGHLHGLWEPHEFASLLHELGTLFGGPKQVLMGVLRLNHGHAVLSSLIHDHHWPPRRGTAWGGLYYYQPSEVFETAKPQPQESLQPGWPEDMRTRPYMDDALGKAITEEVIVLRSEQSLMECLTYIHLPGGRAGAGTGAKDDCVKSLGVGCVLLTFRHERPKARRAYQEDAWEPPDPQTSGVGWNTNRRRV
jgi:hypothetical protein